jgi:hypothetical protein
MPIMESPLSSARSDHALNITFYSKVRFLTQSGHSICPIGPPSNSISGLAGQILTSKVAIMGGTLYVTIIGPGRCEAVNSGPCDAIEMGVV